MKYNGGNIFRILYHMKARVGMKTKRLQPIMMWMLWMVLSMTIYGETLQLGDKGDVDKGYKVSYQGKGGRISRDGGEAVPITSGTPLSKPGTYYLSYYDEMQRFQVDKFRITSTKTDATWKVKTEEDLMEAFKEALEQYQSDVTIQFEQGSFNQETLKKYISNGLEKVTSQYPALMYTGYYYNATIGKKTIVKINLRYPVRVQDTLVKLDTELDAKIESILQQQVDPKAKEWEREYSLFKYMVENVTYSSRKVGNKIEVVDTPMSHTMVGALVQGKAVCDGYAKSLMYLLNAVGIPTKLVVGTADGVPHAWNMVNIQGQFYHVDVTWGDQDERAIGKTYGYFNETDGYMSKSHVWDKTQYPKCVAIDYSLPYMESEIRGVYKVLERREWESTLKKIRDKGESEFTLIFYANDLNKWNTSRLLEQASSYLKSDLWHYTESKYNCTMMHIRLKKQ